MKGAPVRVLRRPAAVLIAALALVTTVPLAPALTIPARRPAVPASSVLATATAVPMKVSLESTSAVIAAGDPFSFTVRVGATSAVSQVTTRFRVYRPSGRLIYQRTRTEPQVGPGEVIYTFDRQTDDLDLKPGAYPVKVSVRSSTEESETELETELLVYDAGDPAVTAVVIARISGQPLAGPDGRFVSDPTRYTRARDDVARLCRFVELDDRVRLTMAIDPLLLEEWRRISLGYELAGPEGVEKVGATSPEAQAFGATLELVNRALATGRLELVTLGYSDPDLSELAAHGLIRDTRQQYVRGRAAIAAALDTTPSAGTVPAGLCVPTEAVDDLRSADISYCVVSSECARVKGKAAASGSYRVANSDLTALVADAPAGAGIGAGDLRAAEHALFDRHASSSRQPVVIVADVRPGAANGDSLAADVTALLGRGWASLGLASDAAQAPRGDATLQKGEPGAAAPGGYWDAVAQARAWAGALGSAIGPTTQQALDAQRTSLVAESSAWAGTDGAWLLADRGRAFADHATQTGRALLDPVVLTIQPITLAGTRGEVPASVANGTEVPLTVTIKLVPEQGLRATGRTTTRVTLQPQDNFFEFPVDLQNSISGRLRVKVLAGDVVLEEKVVTVQASYLDRLAIVGGIVAFLGLLLAFIISRVRAAERREPGVPRPTDGPDEGGEA